MRKWAQIHKVRLNLTAFVLIFALVVACKAGIQELAFESLSQDDSIHYGEENPALLIVARAEDIENLAQDILSYSPDLVNQLNHFDYSESFAILVLQGEKPTTNYSITVRDVIRQGREISVGVDIDEPAIGTRRTFVFTSPYHLIAVRKQGVVWGKSIKFELVANGELIADVSHVIP